MKIIEEKLNDNNDVTVNSKQLEILQKHFPNCFDKTGKFLQSKMLEVICNNNIEVSNESYSLNWLGKSYAKLLANENPLSLLKEDKINNSKDENKNSENILIKGDNLEALKHLKNAYFESIKMIYIDPPYNTGSDGFVYNDNRKFNINELSELASISLEEAKKVLEFTESNSNSHSAWLTFMYPRLHIAKELLEDNGVMFISIDNNEIHQLKLMCDEIFGEENVETYIWNLSDFEESSFTKTASHTVRVEHEYIVACYKTYKKLGRYKEYRLKEREDLSNVDNDPRGEWFSGNISRNGIKSTTGSKYYTITTPTGVEYKRNWTLSKDEYEELLEDNRIYFSKGGDGVPRLKMFKTDPSFSIQDSIFNGCKTSITGKNQLKELFDGKILFDFPKPTNLISRLADLTTDKDSIILDFFAGSGTTAHAIMKLNIEDNGNRKFISIQLPEPIDNKNVYDYVENELKKEPTIFEITKERIIRAAKKIKKNNPTSNADFGLKTFEILPLFDGYNDDINELEDETTLFSGNELENEELEILLTTYKAHDGIKLNSTLEKVLLNNYSGYIYEDKLYFMHKGFETDDLKILIDKLDNEKSFKPSKLIIFGYNFSSKHQREIKEALKNYTNKKSIEIDMVIRY